MKYFKFKTVIEDFTTKSIVLPDGAVAYQYTEDLAGVEVEDTAAFLANQHAQCEVTEKTYEEVEAELKDCLMYHDINQIVQRMIASKYQIADEIMFLKLPVDHSERVAYQEYVDQCRAYGTAMKIERELKQ